MQSTPETANSKTLSRRGRPSGSTLFDRNSLLRDAPNVYVKRLSRNAAHPNQNTVARDLGIGRATLNRYFISYGISWREIRQIAVQKWQEMEGF